MTSLTQASAALLVAAAALASSSSADPPPISVSPSKATRTLPTTWDFATAPLTIANHDRLAEVIDPLTPDQREIVRQWLADMPEDSRSLLVRRMVTSEIDIALRFVRMVAELDEKERPKLYVSLIGDAPLPRTSRFFDLMQRRSDAEMLAGLRERWRLDDRPDDMAGIGDLEALQRLMDQIEAEEAASDPEFRIFMRPLPGIAGGEFASIDEAPFQVEIFKSGASAAPLSAEERGEELDNYGQLIEPYQRWHVCGGVLIAPQWVLTAAHCIRQPIGGGFFEKRRIRTGTDDVTKGGASWRIDAVVVHASYQSTISGNDVALIRIAADAKTKPALGRRAKIARLAAPTDPPMKPGETLMVTGFGVTGASPRGKSYVDSKGNPKVSSKLLLKANLQFLAPGVCDSHPEYRKSGAVIVPGQFCARGPEGVDACQGDSGGPVSRKVAGRQTVVGLVSYGFGCALGDTPGVYVDVRAYRQWIEGAKKAAKSGQIVRWSPPTAR